MYVPAERAEKTRERLDASPHHFQNLSIMPARVEYRLGSIFDEACDLLVIPTSAGGTVTPSMATQLKKAVVPLPPFGMPRDEITWFSTPRSKYRSVTYAASVAGRTSSSDAIQQIGKEVGKLAFVHHLRRVSVPLLGTGAGNLPADVAAEALIHGFRQTAPEEAVMTINVTDRSVFAYLSGKPRLSVSDLLDREIGDRNTVTTPRAVRPGPNRMPGSAPLQSDDAPKPPTAPTASRRSRVFISYSHADTEWLNRLQKHLRPLEREGAIVWADTRIKAGDQWREEIRAALAETKVAVLLVSADFMASEFIVTNELPPLLKAAEDEGATILPVIISASSFLRTPSLSRFQAVNNPDKPLVQLRKANREKVLDDVARAVEDALKK